MYFGTNGPYFTQRLESIYKGEQCGIKNDHIMNITGDCVSHSELWYFRPFFLHSNCNRDFCFWSFFGWVPPKVIILHLVAMTYIKMCVIKHVMTGLRNWGGLSMRRFFCSVLCSLQDIHLQLCSVLGEYQDPPRRWHLWIPNDCNLETIIKK